MKNRLYLLLLSCSMCLAACGDKQCLIKTTTTKHDIEIQTIKNKCNDGRIVSEQEISRTPDGKLIANGYLKEYFDNGKLRSIAFFKNNKQDSIAIRYYESGKKELEYYWENGNQIGFQSVYNLNGKYRRRDYFLKDTTKMFLVTYNENGYVEHLEGTLFHIWYNEEINTLKVGSKLVITTEIVQLDNLESVLSVKFYSPSKKKIIDTAMNTFMKFGNRYYSPKLFIPTERGQYNYEANVKLIDKVNGKTLKEDSTSFSITVR